MSKDRKIAATWASRVLAVSKTGNQAAAISQIRACASLSDVQQLHKLLAVGTPGASSLKQAVDDQLRELSHPRLHRSP